MTDLHTECSRWHFTKSWKIFTSMPQSPTSSHTDSVHRHFTESCQIFTGYATITNVIYLSVYFQREVFFYAHFPYVKPSVIFFDRLSDRMWYYRLKRCRQTLFIGDLVGKKFTDEVWISYRRIRSVGKIVKSCSVSCNCLLPRVHMH